jgi:hypothetical protein
MRSSCSVSVSAYDYDSIGGDVVINVSVGSQYWQGVNYVQIPMFSFKDLGWTQLSITTTDLSNKTSHDYIAIQVVDELYFTFSNETCEANFSTCNLPLRTINMSEHGVINFSLVEELDNTPLEILFDVIYCDSENVCHAETEISLFNTLSLGIDSHSLDDGVYTLYVHHVDEMGRYANITFYLMLDIQEPEIFIDISSSKGYLDEETLANCAEDCLLVFLVDEASIASVRVFNISNSIENELIPNEEFFEMNNSSKFRVPMSMPMDQLKIVVTSSTGRQVNKTFNVSSPVNVLLKSNVILMFDDSETCASGSEQEYRDSNFAGDKVCFFDYNSNEGGLINLTIIWPRPNAVNRTFEVGHAMDSTIIANEKWAVVSLSELVNGYTIQLEVKNQLNIVASEAWINYSIIIRDPYNEDLIMNISLFDKKMFTVELEWETSKLQFDETGKFFFDATVQISPSSKQSILSQGNNTIFENQRESLNQTGSCTLNGKRMEISAGEIGFSGEIFPFNWKCKFTVEVDQDGLMTINLTHQPKFPESGRKDLPLFLADLYSFRIEYTDNYGYHHEQTYASNDIEFIEKPDEEPIFSSRSCEKQIEIYSTVNHDFIEEAVDWDELKTCLEGIIDQDISQEVGIRFTLTAITGSDPIVINLLCKKNGLIPDNLDDWILRVTNGDEDCRERDSDNIDKLKLDRRFAEIEMRIISCDIRCINDQGEIEEILLSKYRIADIDNTISNPDIFVEVVLGFGIVLGLGVLFKFSPVIFHRLKLLGIIKSKKET